ncbi:MAG TPA: exonuclease sbcCD subunit D, partial [Candidatus Atribacteria bacterium]|nr:exonuclease sbcCD subunit D [Candidatus Atribacteria bacterium]
MRIIHTADWHLGKTLYGKNRGEEEIKALGFLKKFIEENDVEVLIIAG